MQHLLLALSLVLAPVFQASGKPADPELPTPERIEQATEALGQAFKKGKTQERLEALEKHGSVNDPKVVDLIAKGLKDKEAAVQLAAVEALRWMPHPDALGELHGTFKRDKKLRKNPALYEAYVWAIGQHGSEASIDLLVDGALASAPRKVQEARIHALGHIRSKRSVEELMDLLQKTGRGWRRGGQPMMAEISSSLHVLTGEDFGRDEETWLDWWRKNEKDFEITASPEGLGKREERAWKRLWTRPEPESEDAPEGERRRRRRGGEDGPEEGDGEA